MKKWTHRDRANTRLLLGRTVRKVETRFWRRHADGRVVLSLETHPIRHVLLEDTLSTEALVAMGTCVASLRI